MKKEKSAPVERILNKIACDTQKTKINVKNVDKIFIWTLSVGAGKILKELGSVSNTLMKPPAKSAGVDFTFRITFALSFLKSNK